MAEREAAAEEVAEAEAEVKVVAVGREEAAVAAARAQERVVAVAGTARAKVVVGAERGAALPAVEVAMAVAKLVAAARARAEVGSAGAWDDHTGDVAMAVEAAATAWARAVAWLVVVTVRAAAREAAAMAVVAGARGRVEGMREGLVGMEDMVGWATRAAAVQVKVSLAAMAAPQHDIRSRCSRCQSSTHATLRQVRHRRRCRRKHMCKSRRT